jgi:hypothetical protein
MMGVVNDDAAPPDLTLPGGVCSTCQHVRTVRSGRGSLFLLCERGLRREAGFAKYPRLPLLTCPGHEQRTAINDEGPR